MRSKLTLTLLLAGALFTMGAKWTEQPIQDFNSVVGAWKGTYIKDGKKYPVSLNIKEDGSYEGEDWQGPLKGTLTIKEGRIQYQGAEQHQFTLTLQQRKKKRLLKGVDERGEFQVSLKPTKTKRAKRKKKKKTKLSLKEAKEITAGFEVLAFTPPPRNISDITAILTQDKPEDLESYKQALALADHNPPATNDAQKFTEFYFRRAQAAHEVGRARQEIEDYRLAVKYGKESSFQYLSRAMWNLGTAEIRGGNFSRGIKLHKASLANETRAGVLSGRGAALASDYARIGDLKAAKRQLARAEQSYVKFVRRASGQILALNTAVVNTARAGVLEATGRLAEAEGYHLRAVAKWEPYKDLPVKAMSASMDSKTGLRVFNWVVARLADNLRRQGRLVEAEIMARKAVREALRSHGRYSAHTADMIHRLNAVIFEQGRYAESEALARANLDIYRQTGAAVGSAYLARARLVLADALLAQGQWRASMAEYDAIRDALRSDPDAHRLYVAENLNVAFALVKEGRVADAMTLLRPVVEKKTALLGEKHYDTAEARGVLAMALAATDDREGALVEFKKAIPILLQRSRRTEDADTTQSARELRLGWILDAYIQLLSSIRGTAMEANADVNAVAEAFRIADVARARTVQRALNASGVRAAVRDPALADLARREQDALTQIGAVYGLLSNALATQDPAVIQELRTRIDELRAARAALMKEIETRFPAYAQLINPKPATLDAARAALQPGETLVTTYSTATQTYVWAISHRGDLGFAVARLGRAKLAAMVDTLRQALDPQVETLGDIPAFDMGSAYELYQMLLGPVEAAWKTSKRLLVVVHGPLGQLPLSVLPTKPVELGKQRKPLFSRYQKVPWLARTHAVTVLPSVSSLVTLRRLPAGDPTRRTYAGFGDPWFSQAQATQAKAETGSTQVAQVTTRGLQVRGLPLQRRSVPQTREATSADLAMLPRLPDTAAEVKSIALALKADPTTDVFVGALASETQVKTMDLSNRKVIAFATHGLVPGDLDGLVQPALALSAPAVTGSQEDGLLTVGEILGLKLNADWIILSACNTAAADGAGAEAVSGLGRAFFYAGARALLVSNWPVETTSAKALTTDLFKRQAKDPALTRAEALRQAMLDLIDGPGRTDAQGKTLFSYAHPIFWAPFTLVGDGG
jgi:CHAT domain-containing protein